MHIKHKILVLRQLCLNPLGFIFVVLKFFNFHFLLSDKWHILLEYRFVFQGKKCNLKNPKLFSEKLQWLKLYDRRPVYHQMVDKYEAKGYIASIVGEGYTIPTLGVWDRFEDIDFNQLPDQFVLKCTHDSGSYIICRDKSRFDKIAAGKKLNRFLKINFFLAHREWQYKGLKPRIIAEPYLSDSLNDYKFFCFGGVPKLFQICCDRNPALGGALIDFFDITGKYLDIKDKFHNRPKDTIAELPLNLEKMIDFSRKLSKGFPVLRVDFYEVAGKLYIGELTLQESAGFCAFAPEKYNQILGDWVELPGIENAL